jgi:hypothetical protein
MFRFASACVLAAALLALPASSEAAPFTATYTGEVGALSDDPEPLQSFPVGTSISFTLTFDDVFMSDTDPAVLFGPARAATGFVDIGGVVYQLTSQAVDGAHVDFINDEVVAANYRFFGTGPVVDGLEFYGLFVRIRPNLTLHTGMPFGSVALGWDVNPGAVASYRYVQSNERTQHFSVEPLDVPTAPLALMMLAGVGAAFARRSRSAPRIGGAGGHRRPSFLQ